MNMIVRAIARPIHAHPVWNSLSWITFTSVETASATPRIALITAVGQPRIESFGIRTGSSSQTRIAAANNAAYSAKFDPS